MGVEKECEAKWEKIAERQCCRRMRVDRWEQ